jgi:hypothetical protein
MKKFGHLRSSDVAFACNDQSVGTTKVVDCRALSKNFRHGNDLERNSTPDVLADRTDILRRRSGENGAL